MFCNIKKIENSYDSLQSTALCLSAVTFAVMVAAIAMLILQNSATSTLSSVFSQKQVTALSIGMGSGCISIVSGLFVLLWKRKTVPASPREVPPSDPSTTPLKTESDLMFTSAPIVEHPLDPAIAEQRKTIQEKKRALREKAQQKIEAAKTHYTPVNWRQFALMNNTSLIKFSSFDRGAQSYTCLNSYINYLQLLKESTLYFPMDESPPLVNELIKVLSDVKDLLSSYPNARFGTISKEELETKSKALLKTINQQLANNQFSYFVAGYCGTKDSAGHAITCKVTQLGENTTFYILNLGEGVGKHPELNLTNTHIKYSYYFYPVEIPTAEWNRLAETFLCHLLRFAADSPAEKDSAYSAQELYDLLSVLGPLAPHIIESLADKCEGNPQHVGDCPEKAVRNTITDYLLTQKQFSADQTRRVFLNVHLTSLISGYHSYQQLPTLHHQELLRNGAEEFAVILLRSKDLLNEEDYLCASEMIDIILNEA